MNYQESDPLGIYRNRTDSGPGPHLMGANTLIGNDVYNHNGEDLGDIKEIISTPSRRYNMKKITTTFVAGLAMVALACPLYAADDKIMNTNDQPKAGTTQYQEGMRAGTSPSAPGQPGTTQSQPAKQAGSSMSATQQQAGAGQTLSADDLKGFEVFSQTGEEIGKITEVRIDEQSHEIKFVTLTQGGVIGIGGKDTAVPLGAFNLDRENERATLTVSEAMLKNAPIQADMSDQDFQRELSNHYGIAPGWEKTPQTGEPQMDQSQKPVPDSAPGLETGSPQIRDKTN